MQLVNPDAGVVGELPGVIQQIAQAGPGERIDQQLVNLRASDMWDMKQQMDSAAAVGWDWLDYLATDLVSRIETLRKRLVESDMRLQRE